MTYSYDPALIKQRGKDQMRFELGDTLVDGGGDTCALADEEYMAILDGLTDGKRAWLSAKLTTLEAILMKMSYQVDTKIDVLAYNFSERAKRWCELYETLKKQISSTAIPSAAPSAVNKSPYFYTGMQENRNVNT